jgi:SAM-dependent methyltransferase
MAIENFISYKDLPLQQSPSFKSVFQDFLPKQNFTHILEIGTGSGGFTLFLRDTLPNAKILTFDISYRDTYQVLKANNVNVRVSQVFNEAINGTDWDICYKKIDADTVNALPVPEIIDNEVIEFLKQPGTKLILCDGGHKVGEFNCLARYLNKGDFIMAHDYADTYDRYDTFLKGRYWDWCEIEEKYIAKSSEENNLVFYNQIVFEPIAWVCKTKLF